LKGVKLSPIAITTYGVRLNKDRINCLIKESAYNYPNATMASREDIVEMMCDLFDVHNLAEEYMFLVAMNGARRITGVFEVSHGTLMSSLIHPREIFSRAILAGAASIILIHNHPSGVLTASVQDDEVTHRIKDAGKLLGIALDDHIVVGIDRQYASIA